ncbi:atlastin-2-like [Amblyomma americanum]
MTTDPSLRGRLSCLSTTFREQLQKLVRSILAPQNLLVKVVNGRAITCQELTTYFQVCTMAFSNNILPKPICLPEVRRERFPIQQPALDWPLFPGDRCCRQCDCHRGCPWALRVPHE